jgi:hypothetical protein
MMKKNKKQGVFTAAILSSIAVCAVGALIAVGNGIFFYDVDGSFA